MTKTLIKTYKKRYQVYSPDGFPIGFDDFKDLKKAKKALDEWAKGYEHQGYYSSPMYGRIPLKEIKQYCNIKEN